jgi:ABC-type sugar transport system ATPase subunit
MILDEPTASLAKHEADHLLEIVKKLKNNGVAILYVSHRMEEVFELGDVISVFRDGQNIGSFPKDQVIPERVVNLMVGKTVSLERLQKHKAGDAVLEVKNLTNRGVIENISFTLHKGEILGLGGLIGSGRTEILRCIFGLDPVDDGEILLNGKKVNIKTPRQAIDMGIGLVPEDRKLQGLMLALSVKQNTSISVLRKFLSCWGWVKQVKEVELVEDYRKSLKIKTQSIHTPVFSLSGGNQQKVVLARWIAIQPQILLLDEPTRGVDIGARAEIQEVIEQLVNRGVAILLVSSDIEELMQLSDRMIVMRNGRVATELTGTSMTKETALQFATGSAKMAGGENL